MFTVLYRGSNKDMQVANLCFYTTAYCRSLATRIANSGKPHLIYCMCLNQEEGKPRWERESDSHVVNRLWLLLQKSTVKLHSNASLQRANITTNDSRHFNVNSA